MEQNKNRVWIIGAIVIVIIGVVVLITNNNKKEVLENTDPVSSVPEDEVVAESTQEADPLTPAPALSLSYAEALAKYKDRRIQLDTVCQAHPNTVTYKDNTGIMIDNRSAQTRTVKAGTTFTIKPYGFKIIVLPDIYLKAKTILVDCDKSQNVATILVQE